MIEAVIRALIAICVVALAVFLIIWVLGALGLALPAMVVKILYIIAALIAVLILWRILSPVIGGGQIVP